MFAAGLFYREAGSADAPVVLLLHGYPESSFMWSGVMPAVADAGWRAVAPDFAGYGDSEPDPPGTWSVTWSRSSASAASSASRAACSWFTTGVD
jgi:pimeloyl-ACP methyl ester carboxylesterase